MSSIMKNMAGMGGMTDQIIVYDALIGAKAAIKANAMAISETYTKSVRTTLQNHLDVAIQCHEKLINYMVEKGYYFPDDIKKQIKLDMKAIDELMKLE